MTFLRELGAAAGVAGFVLFWLAPLYFVFVSRARVVRRRDDMAHALVAKTGMQRTTWELPADHYFTLFMPGRKLTGLTEDAKRGELEREFDRLHGGKTGYVGSVIVHMAVSLVALLLVLQGAVEALCPADRVAPRWGFLEPLATLAGAEGVLPALAGACTATLIELIMRTRAGDLTPDELDECSLRYLVAIPVGRATIALSGGALDGVGAFLVAGLPLKDIQRYLRRRALEKIGQSPASDPDGLMTDFVDGPSRNAVARLEELGIVTYTDLAYANPIRILARTGFSLRLIVQWMDHALLSVYARSHKAALRDAGLPCALDVVEFWEKHFDKEPTGEESTSSPVEALAARLTLDRSLVREIFQRVSIDPHVRFLQDLWYTQEKPATEGRSPVWTGSQRRS